MSLTPAPSHQDARQEEESPLTSRAVCCCYPVRAHRPKTTGWTFHAKKNNQCSSKSDDQTSPTHHTTSTESSGDKQAGVNVQNTELSLKLKDQENVIADEMCASIHPTPEEVRLFDWYDVLLSMAGAALYVLDVYTDVHLAVHYLLDRQYIFASVTLTFVALAYLVTCGFGLKEYWKMYREEAGGETPCYVWVARSVLTLLMMGPVLNLVEFLYHGCQSWRHRKCGGLCSGRVRCERYHQRVKTVHLNNAFLRLFEACLEAAPQLVFQLYVLIVTKPQLHGWQGVWRVATVVSSWLSLAHTLASFTRSRRNSVLTSGQPPSTLRHLLFDTLWRLVETGGRVLCVALFTSHFRFWLMAVLVPHGLVMAGWQYLQERARHPLPVLGYLVYAYVFLFCFINNYCTAGSGSHDHSDGSQMRYSRIQYLAFYLLFYLENGGMLAAWYLCTADQGVWFHDLGLILGLAACPLHVALQLLYYGCCHPHSPHIRVCIKGGCATWRCHLMGHSRDTHQCQPQCS